MEERKGLGKKVYHRYRSYMLHHKFDIWFYYAREAYRQIQRSKTKISKKDLLGVYDIIFVSGDGVEQYASRTAKGTVTITPTDECIVDLDDAGKTISIFLLLSDFRLSNFNFDGKDYEDSWKCTFDAMLEKYEMGYPCIHQESIDNTNEEDFEPRQGFIQRIDNRLALPWMKTESGRGYDSDACSYGEELDEEDKDKGDEEDVVKFNSIEEAARLNYDHENRHYRSWLVRHKGLPPKVSALIHHFHAYRPNPVFFIEPGDFILEVEWSDNHWEPINTQYILRKRKEQDESVTKKRKIGDVYDQEEPLSEKRRRNPKDYSHIWK